jgi:hypothetical protein
MSPGLVLAVLGDLVVIGGKLLAGAEILLPVYVSAEDT